MIGKRPHIRKTGGLTLEVGQNVFSFSGDGRLREEARIVSFAVDEHEGLLIVTAGNLPEVDSQEIYFINEGRPELIGRRKCLDRNPDFDPDAPENLCFSFFSCEIGRHRLEFESNQLGTSNDFELADRVALRGSDEAPKGLISGLNIRAFIERGNGIGDFVPGLTLVRALPTEDGSPPPLLEYSLGQLAMTAKSGDEEPAVIGAIVAMNENENYVLVASVADLFVRASLSAPASDIFSQAKVRNSKPLEMPSQEEVQELVDASFTDPYLEVANG